MITISIQEEMSLVVGFSLQLLLEYQVAFRLIGIKAPLALSYQVLLLGTGSTSVDGTWQTSALHHAVPGTILLP